MPLEITDIMLPQSSNLRSSIEVKAKSKIFKGFWTEKQKSKERTSEVLLKMEEVFRHLIGREGGN